MNLEAGKLSERDKKLKLTEKQKQKLLEKEAFEREERQKLSIKESSDSSLSHLRDAIEHHDIDDEVLKKVDAMSANGKLNEEDIKELIDIISDMEDSEDIKKYLPQTLIISQDDFLQALYDENKRQQTLVKLDSALGHLYHHAQGGSDPVSMIGMVALILDKKLLAIQENHIDIKNTLEDIDEKESVGLFTQIKQALLGK